METPSRREAVWHSPLTWLAAIQLVAAYEWLVSGLDKVLAGNFPQALRSVIADAMKANPQGWEAGFLKGVVLPCCTILGGMVECAEVLVGAVLAVAAVLWVLGARVPGRVRRRSAGAATVACLGAAFMNLTFYVALNGTFPGLSAANATNEGVSIDVVLLLVMLALAAANMALAPRRAAPGVHVAGRSVDRLGRDMAPSCARVRA